MRTVWHTCTTCGHSCQRQSLTGILILFLSDCSVQCVNGTRKWLYQKDWAICAHYWRRLCVPHYVQHITPFFSISLTVFTVVECLVSVYSCSASKTPGNLCHLATHTHTCTLTLCTPPEEKAQLDTAHVYTLWDKGCVCVHVTCYTGHACVMLHCWSVARF